MSIKTNQSASLVLSFLGVVGVLATGYLSAKATPKAMKKIEELKKDGKERTKWEMFRQIAPIYIPAIIVGAATMASTVSSTIISRKTEASLASMALLADRGWRRYKNKVKEVLGIETHKDILDSIAKDEKQKDEKVKDRGPLKLYWMEQIGYFWALPENVQEAYADINQRIQVYDSDKKIRYACTLQDFFNVVEPEFSDTSKSSEIERDAAMIYGWDREYLCDLYGYAWIHMSFEEKEMGFDNEKYTAISFVEEPILNPEGYLEEFAFKSDEEDVKNEYLPVSTFVEKKKG